MGMFDYVYFKCTKCKTIVETQSKAWQCSLSRYSIGHSFMDELTFTDEYNTLEEILPAPIEILAEAERYGLVCTKCNYKVKPVISYNYELTPY